LEDEAVSVEDCEGRRRGEEEVPRRGHRICRRGITAGVPAAARSKPRVEEVKAKTEDLLALLNSRFIREKEVDMWRAAAGDPYPMEKNEDEIPMFMRFTERGLSLSTSNFFKGLMGHYGVEYLNLNPNGIFHTAVFVHFWESSPIRSCSGSSSR
jgi:hypothetical protein